MITKNFEACLINSVGMTHIHEVPYIGEVTGRMMKNIKIKTTNFSRLETVICRLLKKMDLLHLPKSKKMAGCNAPTVCVHVCVYVHIYVYICINTYVYMCVHVCLCMKVCIYIIYIIYC